MADVIIITVLAIVVFFIVRSQLRKLRKGQCGGGCAGCCGSCSGCCEAPIKKTET
ncbi:MAG: FeoB-associated Cys-rich membrane protein [Eubacterium sp.]|nr:FeoB-associated Cys-rich membrane protein [Eubacterium sp.]MCM1217145.1 FeoB-associated Cys-rich membrane protein [Lachnospiraceae bacterium]MCM1240333.1 FeoB-associated Cys-rich membrane protein [Lachnospiraceae bacterium]MCM1303724.1 FeoB-associated Cys-rich membrane protein [Butyrivibrio sp.]MCM1410679.1 FeoB-associated Cys-rich membrane protein [Lachnospiraceae bacterium]